MTDTALEVTDEDLLSDAFIDDPYPFYERLRRTDPVHLIEPLNAWLLTKAADVKVAFSDDRFVLGYEGVQVNRLGSKALQQNYFNLAREFVALMDPPKHSRLRQIFRKPFTAARVRDLAPTAERLAHDCIDRYFTSPPTDVVTAYANRMPALMVGALLGLPSDDHDRILRWSTLFQEAFFATPMDQDYLDSVNAMAADAEAYFLNLVRQRTASPGDDFVSGVIAANTEDPEPMTEFEMAANFFLLYFAGFDTQKQTFTNMLATLDRHPDAMRFLAEDTSRIPAHMHELLRYDPAAHVLARIASVDVELSGTLIRAGDAVLVCPGAAARDPEVYDDPETFDIHREMKPDAVRYMIFGHGRHHCLGSLFAQTNLPIMLKVLLERLPGVRVDWSGAKLQRSFGSRGYSVMPVTWEGEALPGGHFSLPDLADDAAR